MQNKSNFCKFELHASFTSLTYFQCRNKDQLKWIVFLYLCVDPCQVHSGELVLMQFKAHSVRMSFTHVGTQNHTWRYKFSSMFSPLYWKQKLVQ